MKEKLFLTLPGPWVLASVLVCGGLSCRVSHGSAFVVRFCRVQSVRTKEEKEVLEHFAGVVSLPFSTLIIKHGCMWECCKLLIWRNWRGLISEENWRKTRNNLRKWVSNLVFYTQSTGMIISGKQSKQKKNANSETIFQRGNANSETSFQRRAARAGYKNKKMCADGSAHVCLVFILEKCLVWLKKALVLHLTCIHDWNLVILLSVDSKDVLAKSMCLYHGRVCACTIVEYVPVPW